MAGVCSNAVQRARTTSRSSPRWRRPSASPTTCASIGAPIKVSAVCPGPGRHRDRRSGRNRPAELDAPQLDGAAFVEQALADGTAGSMSPAAVADLVVEAIQEERFLVAHPPSYAQQLADRTEDLVAKKLPRSPMFD